MGKSEKNNYRLLLKSGSVIFEITESGKSDTGKLPKLAY